MRPEPQVFCTECYPGVDQDHREWCPRRGPDPRLARGTRRLRAASYACLAVTVPGTVAAVVAVIHRDWLWAAVSIFGVLTCLAGAGLGLRNANIYERGNR